MRFVTHLSQNKSPIMAVHWAASFRDNLSCCTKNISRPTGLRLHHVFPPHCVTSEKERLCGRIKLSPILEILVVVKESRDLKCLHSLFK